MADPRDPSIPVPSSPESVKPHRNEPVPSVTGRSATVAEIGRELGDLDFDPDALLASLHPVEPEAQVPSVVVPPNPRLPNVSAPPSARPNVSAPPVVVPPHPPLPHLNVPPSARPNVSVPPSARPNVSTRSQAPLVKPRVTQPPASTPQPRVTQPPFETAPSIKPPFTLSPPSLGHALTHEQTSEGESHGPDVIAAEELALLQELITLPEERLEALEFPQERPASSHLEQLGLTEAFTNLAELLSSEAQANRHPQERAELALVAAELYAMTGQKAVAQNTLARTPSANIPLYATTLRQLAFDPEDLSTFAKCLRSDLRTSATHEARRHLMALYADVARRIHADEAEQRRHLELSLRAFPTDPRLLLQRLAAQLGDSPQTGSRLRPPGGVDCLGYPEVVRDLYGLRTFAKSLSESNHPLPSCLELRRALERKSCHRTLETLTSLRNQDALATAATWLTVTLGCHCPEHHALVTTLLEQLTERGEEDAELCWLEHRLSSPQTLPSSVEAISLHATCQLDVEDQLGLLLAVTAESETIRLLTEKLEAKLDSNPGLLPLSLEVRQNVLRQPLTANIDRALSAQMFLGTKLGAFQGPEGDPSHELEQHGLSLDALLALSQCESVAAYPTLTAALRLWHATYGESLTATATSLLALTEAWPEKERPYVQVLAALLSELDDNRGQALALLRQCHETHEGLEVVYRALTALSPDTATLPLLERLTTALSPSPRRSVLELELFQQQGTDSNLSSDRLSTLATTEPILLPTYGVLSRSDAPFGDLSRLTAETDERRFYELLSKLSRLENGHTQSSEQELLNLFELERNDSSSVRDEDPTLQALRLLETAPNGLREPATSTVEQDWERLALSLHSSTAARMTDSFLEALGGSAERFDALLAQAQATSDTFDALNAFARAARLDPEREPAVGSPRAALATTERFNSHLSTLRTLLITHATQGGVAKTVEFAERIATQLDRPDGYAHAWLASVGRIQAIAAGHHDALRPDTALRAVVEHDEHPEIWAIRRLLAEARRDGNDELVIRYTTALRHASRLALDASTLALRGAEAALRLQRWDDAAERLSDAVELVPEHLVALSMRAEFLEAQGDAFVAAEAYDALAQASCMPTHQAGAWLHAAELYRSLPTSDETVERATLCLEQVLKLAPTQAEAVTQLRQIYTSANRFDALDALLSQQLLHVELPHERATLEVERAQVLLKLGRNDEARSGLHRALSLVPDDEAALSLLAQQLEVDEQYEEAEQQLLLLASTTQSEERSIEAYRRLAALYESVLEHPTRAETAYRELLRRRPGDPAGDKLATLLLRLDRPREAVELLRQLVEQAKDTPLERDRTLELARIYDAVLKERRRAEEVLEKARRRWTNDSAVLKALAGFYERGKDHTALTTLLERTVAEARRALGAGRFDPCFFDVIATVGELRELPDMAQVAHATHAALSGQEWPLAGIGLDAVSNDLADRLAPEVLSLPLRALLRRTGYALCAATPIDLRALRATPLTDSDEVLAQHISELATAFGLGEVTTYVSPGLEAVCQPVAQRPPTLVMGPAFVALRDPNVKDALLVRALRILSANAAALANTSPVDLWPLLGAYLAAHLPTFVPAGIDATRLEQSRKLIAAALPDPLDRDLPALAADVAASIGNRASQLGLAVHEWGSRTALLALGDPNTILYAIALAAGQLDRLDGTEEERVKWLLRNPEARDLMVFSVTDSYLEARARAQSTPA